MTSRASTSSFIRLNKYLSTAGISSRRKADELIQEGKVNVNGTIVTSLGVKINPARDKVFVNGKQVLQLDEPVYIVLNKPKDCITTASDERGRTTIMDYVKVKQRVYPIGRLDRNTTGVLLLTNDGEFAQKMMHPKFEVKKAYKVTLEKALLRQDGEKLAKGIRLSDGKTEPAEVVTIPGGKGKVIGVIIHEGKNRQVHRMFGALGYDIEKLDRVAYADITYEGLPRGRWRYLTKGETRKLRGMAGLTESELLDF
ncbi:MAG TPA: pseudouridine synthase [Bacteroidota bacterium]|nr:pseudouridine synthase [Bacteroidota bacterium]